MRLTPQTRENGMPITSIREISLLRSLDHPNIVKVLDVAVGEELDDVFMVMEYCEQVGLSRLAYGKEGKGASLAG